MRGHEGAPGLAPRRRGIEGADREVRLARLECAIERRGPRALEVCAPLLEERRGRVERHVPHRSVAIDQTGEQPRRDASEMFSFERDESAAARTRAARSAMKGRCERLRRTIAFEELQRFGGAEVQLESASDERCIDPGRSGFRRPRGVEARQRDESRLPSPPLSKQILFERRPRRGRVGQGPEQSEGGDGHSGKGIVCADESDVAGASSQFIASGKAPFFESEFSAVRACTETDTSRLAARRTRSEALSSSSSNPDARAPPSEFLASGPDRHSPF